MKRAYQIVDEWNDVCTAVIAKNLREAKKIGFNELHGEYASEFTDIRVKWLKGIELRGLDFGIVDPYIGLKRGIYDWADGYECPKCKRTGERLFYENNEIICEECQRSDERGE
jgi:hypothetical protein